MPNFFASTPVLCDSGVHVAAADVEACCSDCDEDPSAAAEADECEAALNARAGCCATPLQHCPILLLAASMLAWIWYHFPAIRVLSAEKEEAQGQ